MSEILNEVDIYTILRIIGAIIVAYIDYRISIWGVRYTDEDFTSGRPGLSGALMAMITLSSYLVIGVWAFVLMFIILIIGLIQLLSFLFDDL